MKSRKKYTANFKSQVALAAIKGEETIAALAQKYELSPAQINLWKKEALANLPQLFEKVKTKKKQEDPNIEYCADPRKIGQNIREFLAPKIYSIEYKNLKEFRNGKNTQAA